MLITDAHAVDVLFKIALGNEFCERVLLEVRDRARVEPKIFVKCFGERCGQHHVADADGAGKAF